MDRPDFRASPRARCSLFCSRALLFSKLWARQALSHWDRYKALKLIELNILKIVKFWVVFLFFHELTDSHVVIILLWHLIISSCYHKYRLISCDMNVKFGITYLPGSRFSSRALSNCGQRARLAQSKKSLKSACLMVKLVVQRGGKKKMENGKRIFVCIQQDFIRLMAKKWIHG